MSIKIYVKYVKNNRDFYTTKMNLPTGNLDKETQAEIIEIFKELAHKENKCIILVTHSKEVSERSDEVYKLP